MLPGEREEALRDMLIQSQPILWARAMLDAAENVPSEDARDAILARVGMTLYSRFGVTFAQTDLRRSNAQWDMS